MKFKRIMLVSLILLAILMLGAVSASDDFSDDNATAIECVDDSIESSQIDENPILQDSQDTPLYDIFIEDDEDFEEEEHYEVKTYSNEVKSPSSSVCSMEFSSHYTGQVDLKLNGSVVFTQQLSDHMDFIYVNQRQLNCELDYGVYDAELIYSGDAIHEGFTEIFSYEVDYIKLINSTYTYPNNPFARFEKSAELTGTISIIVNGYTAWSQTNLGSSESYRYALKDGMSKIYVGVNNITLIYHGNERFAPKTMNGTVTLEPKISIPKNKYYNGYNAYLSCEGPDNMEGTLVVTYNGEIIYNQNITGYHSTNVHLPICEVGKYNVSALFYNEFGSYYSGVRDCQILPNIYPSNNLEVSYTDSASITLSASKGNYKLNCSVEIQYWDDGVKSIFVTMENGVVSIPITEYLNTTNVFFHINYYLNNGDVLNDYVDVEVRPKIILPSQITLFDETNITILVPDESYARGILTFDGNTLYNASLRENRYDFPISGLHVGDYKVILNYRGEDIERNIKVIPKYEYDTKLWVGADNYMTIHVNDDSNGNLSIIDDWNDEVLCSARVTDGYGRMKLENLSIGNHYYYIRYDDVNGYFHEFGKYIEVTETDPFFVMNANIPTDILIGSTIEFKPNFPDKSGHAELYIDGELNETYDFSYWGWSGSCTLDVSGLAPGKHTAVVKYSDPENFYYCEDETYEFNVTHIIFDVPDTIRIYSSNSVSGAIDVRALDNIGGSVALIINNETVLYNQSVSSTSYRIIKANYPFGSHDYEIRYWGSENYPDIVKRGKINIEYVFEAELVQTMLVNYLKITLPYDASGNITVNLNGENYTSRVYSSSIYVNIPDLDFRQYDVNITYTGNERYPQKTMQTTIDFIPNVYGSSNEIYGNETLEACVKTYEDANGTFYIMDDWGDRIYASAQVIKGYAKVTANLDLGRHAIVLKYVDDLNSTRNLHRNFYIYHNPIITAPDHEIWRYADNYISIEMPEKYNGNMSISGYYDSSTIYARDIVVNGTGKVKIPENLTSGYYDVRYNDENGYSYVSHCYLEFRLENPDFKLNITIPDEIFLGKNIQASNVKLPDNKNGYLQMVIDGELVNSYSVEYKWDEEFTITTKNLASGQHNLTIRYCSDSYYHDAYQTFNITVVPFMATVPDEVIRGGNELMTIQVSNELNGSLYVYIDGNIKLNRTLGTEATYSLNLARLELGEHNYTIICTENDNFSKKGSFNVTYELYVSWIGECIYGEDVEIDINTYGELEGNLIVVAAGKTYTIKADGYVELFLSDLEYGDNMVTITYEGDDKYPAKTITQTITMTSQINTPDDYQIMYKADDKDITLLLPSDARGNLTAYWAIYNSITEKYDIGEMIATTRLKDGFASLNIYDLPIGYCNIIIRYEGDDYQVEQVEMSKQIIPKIDYPKGIWTQSSDDYYIFIETHQNDTGNVRVSVGKGSKYSSTLVEELYNGPANAKVTLKMPELDEGTYIFRVEYPDKYISNEYEFTARDTDPNWNISVNFPSVIDLNDYSWSRYNVNNLPDGANGELTLYLDGVESAKCILSNYRNYEFDAGKLKLGTHTWKLVYDKDTYYMKTSANGTFKIINTDQEVYTIQVYDSVRVDDASDYFARINVPDDAYGNVIVTVDNDNRFTIPIQNLDWDDESESFLLRPSDVDYRWNAKEYFIEVSYQGSDYDVEGDRDLVEMTLAGGSGEHYIRVNESARLDDDPDYFAVIHLPDDASGNVIVTVDNDNRFTIPIQNLDWDDESESFRLRPGDVDYGWDEGEYFIEVSYQGSDYDVEGDSGLVEMTLAGDDDDYHVTIFEEAYIDSDDAILEIFTPAAFNGRFIILIDGEVEYNKTMRQIGLDEYDTSFTVTLSDLSTELGYGTYDVVVKYVGDDYAMTQKEGKLTVTYSFAAFIDDGSMDDDKATLDYGSEYEFEMILPDEATGTLTVTFNGKEYPLTYSDGQAKFTIDTSKLSLKQYTITAKYSGDAKYPEKTVTRTFDVVPNFEAPYMISPKEGEKLSVSLPKGTTGTLTLYRGVWDSTKDMMVYTKIASADVKDGQASIDLPEITEDMEYKLEFKSGDYVRQITSQISVVENSPDFKIAVAPGEITVGESVTVSIDAGSVPGEIIIRIDNGKSEYVRLNGEKLTKVLTGLSAGKHTIKVEYLEGYHDSDEYVDTGKFYSNTFTVNVKQKAVAPVKPPVKKADVVKLTLKKVKVKKSAKKLTVQATLKINGKLAKNKKLTFKFNGKKYTAKTNNKGVAKITIKKKVLKKLKVGKKVKIQVTYGKTTKKLSVKVKK